LFAAAIIETRSVQLCKQSSLFSPIPSLPSRPFEFTPNGARRLPPKFVSFQSQVWQRKLDSIFKSNQQSEISALPPRGGERPN
jgi:hypothetical protein